jgi:hypothetical protein
MSLEYIKAALETALQAISSDIDVAWENTGYTPNPETPYLKTYLLPARPEDITIGAGYRRESGIFQVNINYPIQQGSGDALTRAELIKSAFPRGATFSSGGITVHIGETPEIIGAFETTHYTLPVKIRYWADIFN